MLFILIATEPALPCETVILKMTLKRNDILNFYKATWSYNYKSGQNCLFHKEFSLGALFPIQKEEGQPTTRKRSTKLVL